MYGSIEPSQLEVDYDKGATDLYEAICNCDWDLAVEYIRKNPQEARTWVVRHYQDGDDEEEKEIMWRFLPIHSACARDPPAFVISALLKAYPDGAHCIDDQGMYALHYACGNQASREVIRLLLVANSMAAKCPDPRGMLPIHYLACWGPSSVSIIDMVMVANRDVGKAQDNDGNTPLDLAMEGDYPERDAVVVVLKRWLEKATVTSRNLVSPEKVSSSPNTRSKSLIKDMADPAMTPTAIVPVHDHHPVNQDEKEEIPHDDVVAPEEDIEAPEDEDAAARHDEEVAATSRRLTVNTAVDDQVEVNMLTSPLSQVQENHDDENAPSSGEEKESSSANAVASPRTVTRLRQEVSKLRMEKNQSDVEWEQKLKSTVEVLSNKCDEMAHNVDELKIALQEANTRIKELEAETSNKDQVVVDTESQLSDALERIQAIEQENQDLKQDVAALEAENEKLVRDMDNRNERLFSLTASLESMMERQEALMQSVNEKNAQLTEASQARRQNLKMLFDMEQEFMEAVMGGTADELPEFEKQMQEMEAMVAMVAAMKDEGV